MANNDDYLNPFRPTWAEGSSSPYEISFHENQLRSRLQSESLGAGYYLGGHGNPFGAREITDENIQEDMRRQMERDNEIRRRFDEQQRLRLEQWYTVGVDPVTAREVSRRNTGVMPMSVSSEPIVERIDPVYWSEDQWNIISAGPATFGGTKPFAKPETLEEQEAKYFNNYTE